MAQLINVSNRLPITLGEGGEVKKSSGGLVAALEGLPEGRYEVRWIGWPGGVVEKSKEREVRERLVREVGCVPVFLSAGEQEGFYEGFSNSSVWPLLHYMTNYMRYEAGWWEDYRGVNERFAGEVLKVAGEEDLVWVHDYQLMLVPGMIKRERPGVRVGFFLHTPFPSYEVFRCHPKRNELIEGMLGADLIGFHTFGYLRHFRSAAMRLLGVETEITHIRMGGRESQLGVYPIGINSKKFEQGLGTEAFAREVNELEEAFGRRRVIVSVERLDYTKGILHRLDAIEQFLEGWEDRDGVKFVFVSVPSREKVEEYQQLRADVESRVGRINGKYATLRNSPLHFIHGSVEFAELLALYARAEVAVVTPLVDGMNLVAKEYVAAQREGTGVLVLSEFAGAAQELFSALVVNPYDTRAVAGAIREALAMSVEERRERMGPMRERVMRYDAAAWANDFVGDLERQPAGCVETGSGEEAMRIIRGAIGEGKRVGLFLDYDGTLREIEREPRAAGPNAGVREVLEMLRPRGGRGGGTEAFGHNGHGAGEGTLDVTIISGRRAEELEEWLGGYGFGLIAEHGAAVRRPGGTGWERLDADINYSWKEEIGRVLRQYAESVPGSFVEEKRTSLVWHYRKSDPEFGEWKAKQLVEELSVLTTNQSFEVRRGRKIVEVTVTEVNKGAAVRRVVAEVGYDVILVAGDDVTDESMFRLEGPPEVVSVKVGWGETHARFRVPDVGEMRRMLREVAGERVGAGV